MISLRQNRQRPTTPSSGPYSFQMSRAARSAEPPIPQHPFARPHPFASPSAPAPMITADRYTADLLLSPVSVETLRQVVDPAGLMNQRLAVLQIPTRAVWRDAMTGAATPVNASHMSTYEMAVAMRDYLRGLGLPVGEVNEQRPENAVSRIDYAGDPRRHFAVGDLNVGLLFERYARNPKEVADQMTLAELRGSLA